MSVLKTLMPATIIFGTIEAADYYATWVRLHQTNYTREHNMVAERAFGSPSMGRPMPRRLHVDDRLKTRQDKFYYETVIGLPYLSDKTEYTKPDETYQNKDKWVTNDLILKKTMLSGKREKGRYDEIFDKAILKELPFFYKRWVKRNKERLDQEFKDCADNNPLIYGVPYWQDMASDDLL